MGFPYNCVYFKFGVFIYILTFLLISFGETSLTQMKSFQLRLFKPTDLDAVIGINLRTLPEHYSPYFYLELYQNHPKTFIVAEGDGKIVGYVMCRMEVGASEFKLPIGVVRKGHVVSIAVLPEFRRQGIGVALMTRAMQGMRDYGAEECFLEVRVSNVQGIGLYRKLGFQIVRKICGYYYDGEDACVMARKL